MFPLFPPSATAPVAEPPADTAVRQCSSPAAFLRAKQVYERVKGRRQRLKLLQIAAKIERGDYCAPGTREEAEAVLAVYHVLTSSA